MFFVVLLAGLLVLNLYVYRRAHQTLALAARGKRLLAGVLLLGGALLVGGRLLHRLGIETASVPLAVVGSTIELAVMIAAGLLIPIDVVRGVEVLLRRFRRASPAANTPGPVANAGDPVFIAEPAATSAVTRRDFVQRSAWGAALAFGGTSSIYGAVIGRTDYAIEEIPLRLPGLPASLDGYTIVQLSDIHFGPFVGEEEIRTAEDLVRRTRADAVVLTGDIVDHDPRFAHLGGRLASRLAPHSRDGVFAILGNHDHYTGVDEVRESLRRGGATILENEGLLLSGSPTPSRGHAIALLGVDDLWAARRGGRGPDLARALATVPDDIPRILLCHNPAFFPEAAPYVQLQLSGHTHGGQINLLGTPELVLPFGYVAGRYVRDEAQLYVNRGFGTAGPPARLNSPPEVTKIVLVS